MSAISKKYSGKALLAQSLNSHYLFSLWRVSSIKYAWRSAFELFGVLFESLPIISVIFHLRTTRKFSFSIVQNKEFLTFELNHPKRFWPFRKCFRRQESLLKSAVLISRRIKFYVSRCIFKFSWRLKASKRQKFFRYKFQSDRSNKMNSSLALRQFSTV